MTDHATTAPSNWRSRLPESIRPYSERAPLAALFLGMSSGFPFAMIGATLTTRLAEYGITKSTVTAFALTFLAYNFKFLWAPMVDNFRLPFIHRFGQRRSWLWVIGILVMFAVFFLGSVNPQEDIGTVALAAILVGIAGATYDIVIDAYRIELLEPRQLGVGSGMSQYGWRIGSAAAGALALVVASSAGWTAAYAVCAIFSLPAMLTALVMGEPHRHREPAPIRGPVQAVIAYFSPLVEFVKRQGALVVLLFVLIHKIGDTLANLTLRLLFEDLGFTKNEVASTTCSSASSRCWWACSSAAFYTPGSG
jgi:PAT family beta-lactamase induction signal transducer AmpG